MIGWLRRALKGDPPIADRAALADYIDGGGAYVVQKCLIEYSRARAGIFWQALFNEKPFQEALEAGRWVAYPLGLVIVTELLLGEIGEAAPARRAELRDALAAIALERFDAYPVPEAIGAERWAACRVDLERRLALIPVESRRPVKDIPKAALTALFDSIPIHGAHREYDQPVVLQQMKGILIDQHRSLVPRLDRAALVAVLLGTPQVPSAA